MCKLVKSDLKFSELTTTLSKMRSPSGMALYFPTLSVNSILSFFQFIVGVGIPSATQVRTALESSMTVYSTSVLRILGGTVKRFI